MAEQFIVSARKYRPNSFSELLGQDAISLTLRRAINQNKTAHAYLFCGPRGVGKTSAARIFAKTINCLHRTSEGEACGECESCKAFEEQRSLNIFELDAASNNSTEDIRRLIDEVAVPPQFGRYKVYIIDEVHMLSQSAFNAFLKTLEEPPSYVVFILATTEKQKILPTILSRCQVYDFKPIPSETIQQQLQNVADSEAIEVERKALELIAQQADGGMRDALSLFDRLAGFGNGKITYELTIESLHILNDSYYLHFAEYIKNNDVSALLALLDEVINKGFDPKTILLGLQNFFRKLMLAADSTTFPLAKLLPEEEATIRKMALDLGRPFLYQALLQLVEAEKKYRASSAKRLLVEMTLIGFTSLAKQLPEIAVPNRQRVATEVKSTQVDSTARKATIQPTIHKITPRENNTPKESRMLRTTGILQIKKNSREEEREVAPTAVANPSTREERKESYEQEKRDLSEANLVEAWTSFAEKYVPPTHRMDSALIRGRKPFIKEGKCVAVAVGSKAHLEQLKKYESTILGHLKQFFGDTEISFEIIHSKSEEKAVMQSKSEWFQSEVSKNKALQDIVTDLQLREY